MTSKDLAHLEPKTRAWVRRICSEYVLESHHERLLLLAAQSWDRLVAAREAIAREGSEYIDAKGVRRPTPAIKVEADSTIRFSRLLRELDLDIDAPSEVRPPAIRSNRPLTSLRGGKNAA